ncbi:ABC transporter substrate-binding protein [Bdellovibrio bacteriovorus]|uniref:Putative solute-binding periplasmic protein of ABC transport n=1 Tax=Bdellovibrio bacteriovorus (strain ATCC 15356 / DSM 50701 / NCIMB 9529 / HD100) TaxID=264462 RepID=Q6MJM3_BDEBA|nr:ABC transporter substrate-binding protein [Bdellovibrio bacteriovorus]CAE80537.1 putative solute-binding periplasmic protein of ABC transport [Bdellovibrio bacteriovorus HD100]
MKSTAKAVAISRAVNMKAVKLLLSLFVLLLLFVFNFEAKAQTPDVVRVGNLKFAHYGAISYMSEYCSKYNLKVTERVFAKGIDIMPAIIAGEIDVAASAADAAIAGRSGGVPIFAVAGFAQGGARIVIRPDLGIKSVKDFKGKKVGVARGGAQELLLLAELAKHNLTWSDQPGKDVRIVYMAFADLNQALQAKNIDAMAQSEPQASQAINKGFGVELLKPYDTPMGEPVRTLVMTEKMYNTKKPVAERFMKCFVEATKAFIEKPELAEKYVIEKMFKNQITSQDFKDAIGNSPYTYDLTVEHMQITTDFMVKYGVGRMQKPPKAADWVKLDLLTDAKKALGVK